MKGVDLQIEFKLTRGTVMSKIITKFAAAIIFPAFLTFSSCPAIACECVPECGSCQTCQEGVCVDIGDCKVDGDCQGCESCPNCHCIDDDSECSSCERCQYGECVPLCTGGNEKCCPDSGGYCCGSDQTCCEGNCCGIDECCDDGVCVPKCTNTGQCSYEPPESNYVGKCENFDPTDKTCEDIVEGALCGHVITVAKNDAECADCAPNCDKTRICACAQINPVYCKTRCWFLTCACLCDDVGEPYVSGDHYECD